ncbi:uncharacterized protein LOC135079787 isoform X2 [Ostrinia nubilalis]
MQHGSCSREDSIVPSRTTDDYRNERFQITDENYSNGALNEKKFAEKTTYCRPSTTFKQEFINKTVERNNRLQRLVKKLILIRKKEKQTEAWNNYINELKNKHKYYDTEFDRIIGRHTLEEPTPHEYINDYYDNQSRPCRNLLQDFYDAYSAMELNSNNCKIEQRYPQNYKSAPRQNYRSYFSQSNCYPMSSQGRLMMLNRERKRNPNEWQQRPTRPVYGNVIYVDKEPPRARPRFNDDSPRRKCCCAIANCAIQTEHSVQFADEIANEEVKEEGTNTGAEAVQETVKEAYARVSENVERLKARIQESCSVDRRAVLESIENKLDSLITSINSFIDEVKSRTYVNQCYDCRSVYLDRPKPCSHNMNVTKSDTYGMNKAEKLVCGIITEDCSTPSTSGLDKKLIEKSRGTTIDRILMEEINSSNRAKQDIENMLSGSVGCPCSVQISFDIPTKERSTEVTESLEKAVPKLEDNTSVSIEEIDRSVGEGDAPQMTIAVNTDPLGLLALLRVSKEAVKQLLSYMPNIPYHSYILSMMNTPQSSRAASYICNICGAAFRRPSQLSDHIQGHDLTKTRDCCVCRHILDMQRHRSPGLFRCRYCGQRFTRAYCCELHQEACARRLGRTHDVSPSLMLLR